MATRTKTVTFPVGNWTGEPSYGKVWLITSGGTVWTDKTTDVNDVGANDVSLGGAVDDALYLGSANPHAGFRLIMSTGSSGGTHVYEYWNGSTWATLTTGGSSTVVNSALTYWSSPSDWATTQVNSESDGPWYYIRIRVTGTRTTGGIISQILSQILGSPSSSASLSLPEASASVVKATLSLNYTFGLGQAVFSVYGESRTDSNAFAETITRFSDTGGLSHSEGAGVDSFWDETTKIAALLNSGGSGTYDIRFGTIQSYNGDPSGVVRAFSAELLVTYEYDDTTTTQMNTLILPFDSITGELTTSLATVGTIPALTGGSGLIQEASPSVYKAYVLIEANTSGNGTTDYELKGRLDSDSETTIMGFDAGSNSKYTFKALFDITSADLTTTHTFDLRTTALSGARFSGISFKVVVTYTYNDSTTTTYTRTLVMPVAIHPAIGGSTTSDNASVKDLTFNLPVASPTLLQSGVQLFCNWATYPADIVTTIGTNSARTISISSNASGMTGSYPIIVRFDDGGFAGTDALTLAQGNNTLTVKLYTTNASAVVGTTQAMVYLNISYTKTSTKLSTVFLPFAGGAIASNLDQNSTTFAATINETNYEILQGGFIGLEYSDTTSGLGVYRLLKGTGLGWLSAGGGLTVQSANRGTRLNVAQINSIFKMRPNDPAIDDQVDIETSHTVSHDFSTGSAWSGLWLNYHDYSYTLSGTISGSSGGTVTIKLIEYPSCKVHAETSRTGNGTYSFTIYNSAQEFIVIAVESDSLKGASKQATYATDFDIDLAGGGSSTTVYGDYGFMG